MNKIDFALKYAGLGIRVFPIKPNSKTPAVDGWPDLATTDRETIKRWWAIEDYNIGVATGQGVIAVDADVKNNKPGLASLEALDLESIIPQSFRTTTPSSGVHVLLRTSHPVANRVDTIEGYRGIDIRGENGYVLGAGSEIDGAKYTVLSNGKIEDMPPAFAEVLSRRVNHKDHTADPVVDLDDDLTMKKAIAWLQTSAPDAVEGAGGDEATFRTAAWLRDLGLSEGVALENMLEHWNDNQSPPWQPDELAVKVSNAYAYATGTWGGRSVQADFDAVEMDVGERPAIPQDAVPKNVTSAVAATKRRSRFVIHSGATAAQTALNTPYLPLIDGVLNQHTFGLIYGRPGATKTFNVLDMCICIAMGKPWADRYATTQGPVLYLALEGGLEIHKRVSTAYLHHGAGEDTPFFYVSASLNMVSDDGDAKAIIKFAEQIEKKCGRPVSLIVIDTLFRSLGGGDENSGVDMGRFVTHADTIREATRAALIAIHHTGKDEARGARGHSSLLGALDTEIFVSGEGVLTVTKQRDMIEIENLAASVLMDIEIGQDVNGRVLKSAAVRYADVGEFASAMPLSEGEEDFMAAFTRLSSRSAAEGRGGVVGWSEWVTEHRSQAGDEGASNRNLRKMQQSIQAAGWITRKQRDAYILARK